MGEGNSTAPAAVSGGVHQGQLCLPEHGHHVGIHARCSNRVKKGAGQVRKATQEQLIGLFLRLVCTSHEPRESNVITLVLQRKSAQKGLGLTLGTYVDRWRNDDGSISVDEREKDLSYHRVDGIKSGSIAERQGILLGDVILELNGTCMLALFRCDRSFACRPKLARI